MPNDFSKDSRIIEVWRFENNLNAEKNGNHLTASSGGVGYTSSNPLEGSYSLDLEADNNQWAYRNDANLSSGFPLKSGDTNKKITIFLRAKPESVTSGGQMVIGKAASGKYCFSFGFATSGMYFYWGYNNGASTESWLEIRDVTPGKTYHIAILIDGIAKTCKLRIWVDGTAYNYTKTFNNELSVTDAAFVVGNNAYYRTAYDYDGLLDEIVVANTLLTDEEIDLIYAGNYSASLVASQVLGQVSYLANPSLQISQALAQVAYQPASALPEEEGTEYIGILNATANIELVEVVPASADITGAVQVVAVDPQADPDARIERQPVLFAAYIRYAGTVEYVEPDIAKDISSAFIGNVRLAGVVSLVRQAAAVDYDYSHELVARVHLVPAVSFVPISLTWDEGYLDAIGTLRIDAEELYLIEISGEIPWVFHLTGRLRVGSAARLMLLDEPAPFEQIAKLYLYGLPPVEDAEDAETWVLTGNGWQVSCYSNYGFNSYVNIGGVCYGAKSDGIYLLDGDDDNGEPIRPGIRLISDFMTSNLKRLRHVQFGRCGRKAILRVKGRRSGQKVVIPHDQQRFIVPRQLVDQEFVFDLLDFEEVSQAEFVVLPWVKR